MELFVYNLGSNGRGEQDYLLESTSRTMVDIMSVLLIYRLRHKTEIQRVPPKDLSVYFTEEPPIPTEGNICPNVQFFPDPRAAGFGYRVLARPGELEIGGESTPGDYIRRRLEWGIGEGRPLVTFQLNSIHTHLNFRL